MSTNQTVPLVAILWNDSVMTFGWKNPADWSDVAMRIVSVGFLVRETDDRYVLCQSLGDEEDTDNIQSPFTIPKSCVVRKIVLAKYPLGAPLKDAIASLK